MGSVAPTSESVTETSPPRPITAKISTSPAPNTRAYKSKLNIVACCNGLTSPPGKGKNNVPFCPLAIMLLTAPLLVPHCRICTGAATATPTRPVSGFQVETSRHRGRSSGVCGIEVRLTGAHSMCKWREIRDILWHAQPVTRLGKTKGAYYIVISPNTPNTPAHRRGGCGFGYAIGALEHIPQPHGHPPSRERSPRRIVRGLHETRFGSDVHSVVGQTA